MAQPVQDRADTQLLDDAPPAEDPVYRVGTLVYTSRGLVILFFWMLFGESCYTMAESIVPSVVPLLLKNLSVSNTAIAVVTGIIPNIIMMIVTPILSYRSDRRRGPWGRRIPYLLLFSPIVAACVILTGFSPDIGAWLHGILSDRDQAVSKTHVLFLTIAGCSILYQFFNLFVYTVYYYLFNDVIPATMLGRFYALFKIVGAISGFAFSRYIFGLAETHMRTVFSVIAAVYLVSFMLMCWNVREGEYPPPPASPARAGRIRRWIEGVRTFVRECYSDPFYWPLYIAYSLNLVGGSGVALLRPLFAANELNMTWDEMGRALSWGSLISLILYYPLGWLADRIHPMRLLMIGMLASLAIYICSAVWIHSMETFVFWTLVTFAVQAIVVSANQPLLPRILPKSRFGQFSSAIVLLSSGAVILGNFAIGKLADRSSSYTIMYMWSVWFTMGSVIFYAMFYRGWLRRGGAARFVPPL